MSISMKEVKLFASTGRLIKSISRSELPKEMPDIISYAGNIYGRGWNPLDYTERTVHVYEEKPLTSVQDRNASMDSSDLDPVPPSGA